MWDQTSRIDLQVVAIVASIGLLLLLPSVEACFGSGTTGGGGGGGGGGNPVVGASPVQIVRCDVNGAAICYDKACPFGTAQVPADVTFTDSTSCSDYLKYTSCRSASTNALYCEVDIPGCRADDFEFSSTYYSDVASCMAAFPSLSNVRCVQSTGRSCVASTTSCSSTQMRQPASSIFLDMPSCLNYVGKVRCYNPADNSFSCVTDVASWPPCGSLIQVSNTMDNATCVNYFPQSYTRCVTTSTTACRPAGFVTWAESSTADTSYIVRAVVSEACQAGEVALPGGNVVMLERQQCISYSLFVQCYTWSTNTWQCTSDYACLGAAGTVSILDYSSTTAACPAAHYVPTTFVRCTSANPRVCRPIIAGCSETLSETQNPVARTFPTQAFCESYNPVPNKWIRCKSALNSSPYCVFEACNDGDERLAVAGSVVEFDVEGACNAAKFQGQICYEARTAGTFAVTSTFDHSGISCPAGQRLINAWIAANSEIALQAEAIAYYAVETNPIVHYRCLSSISKPVCRPDMNTGTPSTADCGNSETLIATPTAALNTLADCKATLYLAKPCYRALKTAEPYYEIVAALDTSAGCSAGTELELEGTYQPGTTQALATTAAINRGVTLYAVDAPHFRCKVTNSITSEIVPVCRPDMGANDCATDEEKRSTGPGEWSSLAACLAARYYAKPCYAPLRFESLPEKFYTIEPAYDTIGTCANGQLELSSAYADFSPTKPVNVAARESLLDALPHVRCGNGGGATSPKTPICRPKMTAAVGNTGSVTCAFTLNTESQLTTAIGGVTEWISLANCNSVRYVAKPCYRATSIGPDYYSIVPGYDTATTGGCASNEADITLGFISASSTPNVANYDPTIYTSVTTGLPHSRCKLGPGSPICRPDMLPSTPALDCAAGIDNDTILLQQPIVPYDSYAACTSQRWWAKACYLARTSEITAGSGQFYGFQPLYDHSAVTTCGTGQFEVSTTWFQAETAPPDFSSLHPTIEALPHYRCKRGITPYCRPDMTAAVGNTNSAGNPCAIGETLMTTSIGGLTSWPTMSSCNAVRYAAIACYVAQIGTQPAPFLYYYSITAEFDSDTTTTCASGRLALAGQQLTAANREDVTFDSVKAFIEAQPHYRCRYSATVIACRPDMTLAVDNAAVPSSPKPGKCSHSRAETQLNIQRPAFNSKDACTADTNTYYIPCYYRSHLNNYVDLTTPSFNKDTFSTTPIFRCVTDVAACPGSYVQLPFDLKNVDFTDTTACDNYKTTINWVLCRKVTTGVSAITYSMCRPESYGCDSGETLVTSFSTGSLPFSSVSNCLGAVTASSETSRCCCSKSGSRGPCGTLVSTGTYGATDYLITGCDCSGCTPAGTWTPVSSTAGRFYLYSSAENAC